MLRIVKMNVNQRSVRPSGKRPGHPCLSIHQGCRRQYNEVSPFIATWHGT